MTGKRQKNVNFIKFLIVMLTASMTIAVWRGYGAVKLVVLFAGMLAAACLAVFVMQSRHVKELISEGKQNVGVFAGVLGRIASGQPTGAGQSIRRRSRRVASGWRHIVRILLFFLMIVSCLFWGTKSRSYAVGSAAEQRWLICALLFWLTGLCYEDSAEKCCRPGILYYATVSFLLFGCFADFLDGRKFRYAAFCMLMFGGLFCRVWRNMRRPDDLLEEFATAYRLSFLAVLVFCAVCRPAYPGICYTGAQADVVSFGSYLLIAEAVFLSGMTKERTGVPNGIGAACSVYLVWTTQQATFILVACAVLILYGVFWIRMWLKAQKHVRLTMLLNVLFAAAAGIACVLALRFVLYEAAPLPGCEITFGADERNQINGTMREYFTQGGWKTVWNDRVPVLQQYIAKFNFRGHKYLAKLDGEQVWPCISAVMVTYRYGILAGASYLVMIVACLYDAAHRLLSGRSFLAAGILFAAILTGLCEPVELPFVQISWLAFYIGLCRLIAAGKEEHEISQYKN